MSSGAIPSEYLDRITVVASATVLVYDLLCTLDQEIEHVWNHLSGFGSIIFFLNRYLPFIDTFLSLSLSFDSNISPEECRRLYPVVTCFIVVGTFISEAILMLRTYAIWERRRSILIILVILALGLCIPGTTVTIMEVQSLRFARSDSPIPGCHIVEASKIIFVAYVLLVLTETTMVVLTLIQAYRYMREHSRSDWIISMYRTGVLYYFYLLAISLANILVPLLAPSTFANLLAAPQRIFHSIMCTRLLFFLFRQRQHVSVSSNQRSTRRGAAYDTEEVELTEAVEFTTLHFDNTSLCDSESDPLC